MHDRHKIVYSAVDGIPEINCKWLKEWSALADDFRTFNGKALRIVAWQRRHLGTGFYLEHSNRIRFADGVIHVGLIRWNVRSTSS
jgi:hypothetical protein